MAGKKKGTAEEAGSGNINQIRDILVGPFQREQEARLRQLEKTVERHRADAEAAQDKLSAKLAELRKVLKESDKDHAAARSDLRSELHKALDEARDALASDLGKLDSDSSKERDKLRADLEQADARLEDEKADRHALADYFMEISLHLRGESTMGAIDDALKGSKGGAKKS